MCTYVTETVAVDGSGKAAAWFPLRRAAVYVDHPHHAPHDHTVNIDFGNPDLGPSARVAVELTEESALALVVAIHAALAAAPPGLASSRPPSPQKPTTPGLVPPAIPPKPRNPRPRPARDAARVVGDARPANP